MNNFDIIYKILHILEKAMDVEDFDVSLISADALKISDKRWCSIMEMLGDNGYVKGASVKYSIDGTPLVNMGNIRITLQGLEYLSELSLMKKAANIAKGIKESIPGL